MKKVPLPNYINRSGSHFETTQKFLDSSCVIDSTRAELMNAGIPLTQINDHEFATSAEELHCFIIGDTGCGKTRRVILPTIRLLAKTGESMVISDPKGELYKKTAYSLEKKGYKVQILNFRNPRRGNRWNPLGLIEKLYRSGDEERRDKAVMMLNDIIDVLQGDKNEQKDPYWILSAGNLFRGVALMILEYGEEGDLTFENIGITARNLNEKMSNGGLKVFLSALPVGSPIEQNLSGVLTNASDTRKCIFSEFEAMIGLYVSQELLLDLFSTSEIEINELGFGRTALFFILPDDSKALYPIATVFVKQIYSSLVELADEQLDGKLPNRVTFLLDEFANFAKMPSIDSMLTAARSRAIRFVLVCQSMDQLTEKYQEYGKETLLANCRVWLYMSCRNLTFLERLERLMGDYVNPYTQERSPLIDVGELQHLEIGQVLVLNDRCYPMMGYLPDYSKYDFGSDSTEKTVETPLPHEPLKRKKVNFDETVERAKNNRLASAAQELDKQSELDGDLRSSILGRLESLRRQAEEREENARLSSLFMPDSVEMTGKRQEKLPVYEKITGEEHGNVSEGDSDVMAVAFAALSNGDFLWGAKTCIEKMNQNSPINEKNALAFLIRYGKVDVHQLSAPFSLKISDLLQEGVAAHEPYSVLNEALYDIENRRFKKAARMLESISASDWEEIAPFWMQNIFGEHGSKDPEGALVAFMAINNDPTLRALLPDGTCNLLAIAKTRYKTFIDSKPFMELFAGAGDTSSGDSAGGEMDSILLAQLTDNEPDESAAEDKDKNDIAGEMRAQQLRKRIQKALEQVSQSDEDED